MKSTSIGKKVVGNERAKKAWFIKNYLRNWQLYCLLLLPITYIIIFAYVPMAGIQIAFKKFDLLKGIWGSPWIGVDNFLRFLNDLSFYNILRNTVTLSLYSLLVGFPLPILLALVLNSFPNERFKKTVQTVSYIPHFISTVVIVGMLIQLFNPRTGAVGNLIFTLGDAYMPDMLAKPNTFPHMYVWSGIWQGIGWSSIIYVAALSGVDAELHEAAQIDGASRFQRVLYVDIPALVPTAVIMLILAAGNIMSVGFEKIYLMQNNLNLSRSEVISTYVYKVSMVIGTGDYSFGTAIGVFNSVINLMMLSTVNAIVKKMGRGSLW